MLSYRSLIMDVDGVIFDSNRIKEQNIRVAAEKFLKGNQLKEFINYFVSGNGIPRETKIATYFGEGSPEYHMVLQLYSQLNSETLVKAPMTHGTRKFLEKYYKKLNIWAVSGGAEPEVLNLMQRNDIVKYFKGIHGGPISKKDHLKTINLSAPVSYIGDSKADHLTAIHLGANFIFMTGYTQFLGWEEYFHKYPEVQLIRNLSEL